MLAVLVLRVVGAPRQDALDGVVGELVVEPVVEPSDLGDRVGLELGEADVEELRVACRVGAEGEAAVDGDAPLLHVELADVDRVDGRGSRIWSIV